MKMKLFRYLTLASLVSICARIYAIMKDARLKCDKKYELSHSKLKSEVGPRIKEAYERFYIVLFITCRDM